MAPCPILILHRNTILYFSPFDFLSMQLILFGAGYDTSVFRFHSENVLQWKVYEVNIKIMQIQRQNCLCLLRHFHQSSYIATHCEGQVHSLATVSLQ